MMEGRGECLLLQANSDYQIVTPPFLFSHDGDTEQTLRFVVKVMFGHCIFPKVIESGCDDDFGCSINPAEPLKEQLSTEHAISDALNI